MQGVTIVTSGDRDWLAKPVQTAATSHQADPASAPPNWVVPATVRSWAAETPGLVALRKVTDPQQRARDIAVYITRHREAVTAAAVVRDDTIRELLRAGLPMTKAAALASVSVSHVKMVKTLRGAS